MGRVLTKGALGEEAVQEASLIMPSFLQEASSRATGDAGVFEGEEEDACCSSCES